LALLRTVFETAKVLHFAIFFIGKIHFRLVFSRGACEAVKTAFLLVVDEAVEATEQGGRVRISRCNIVYAVHRWTRRTVSVNR